jgi:DNA-binding CsgD family transcriptional regulator
MTRQHAVRTILVKEHATCDVAAEGRTAMRGLNVVPRHFAVDASGQTGQSDDRPAVDRADRRDPVRPAGFVGRESALSRLLGALGGDARLVLVVGDAGVGKTRFVAEGMARAAAAGVVMVRGECLPLSGTLPLHPVADALGDLGRLLGGRLLAAALEAAPDYVRDELARLLPGLGPRDGAVPDGADGEWSRERLFVAVAELLAGVADRSASGVGLVVEDVHWADSATLDCLTVLFRTRRRSGLTVVVTCRGDEPLAAHVAGWLAQARSAAGVEEIRLGPLSRAEVAGQAAALAGAPVPTRVIDELYSRAEGNPFFTEQLVAAALASGDEAGQGLRVPAGLPARLAELLMARADRCAGDARVVLAGLAVAGRPLAEPLLREVTGLEAEAVRRGLRELAAARLLAEDTSGGGHRPRHALLTEAVASQLLPGERAALHERTARALAQDPLLAAEAAGHWQAAGKPAEELPARAAAAKAAERVFGYAEAAAHRQRAIELCQAHPDVAAAAEIDVPRLYVRAVGAFFHSGDSERAGAVAEEAYHRFANHPDPATAAVVRHCAAYFQTNDPAAAGRLMAEALQLFEQAPPSFDHADALLDYATTFLLYVERRPQASLAVLHRALEIAEAVGATAMIPRILSVIAFCTCVRGQVEEGFAILERGWALARAARDGAAMVWLAVNESYSLLKLAQYQRAAEVAARGLDAARQAGLEAWEYATILVANAAEALVALGRTAEAAALIDPLISTPPRVRLIVNVARAEIDLLRGDIDAAAERWQLIHNSPAIISRMDIACESASRAADAALWAGRPGAALQEARRALALFTAPDLTIFCGRLLVAGLRACADLAEQARARRDEPGIGAAVAAADDLAVWAEQMGGAPFTDHPFVATIPAVRATWDAERSRLAGPSDPGAWDGAARAWQRVGRPHRAGYAWWRQAQAHLDAGQTAAAATALRAAATAADGHAPLLGQIRTLAERARIPLQPPANAASAAPPTADVPAPYGLTGRELAVLRLVTSGRTNAQIGAELYISPKTAGVHVSNILRKLGVSSRVQAAALAERAGLLPSG